MRDKITLILFMLVPYAFVTAGIAHVGHRLFLLIVGLILIACLTENNWFKVFFIYAACWQVWLFLIYWGKLPHKPRMGIEQLVFFTAAIIIFVVVKNGSLKKERFFDAICISALLQSILAVFQINKIDPIVNLLRCFIEVNIELDPSCITGTLFNNNFLAAYLGFTLPFFFRPYWKYCIPLLVVLIYWAKTSMAVMSVLVGMAFYFGGGYLRIVIAIVLGCLYSFLLDKPFFSYDIQHQLNRSGLTDMDKANYLINQYSSTRFGIWAQAIKEIFDSWWTCIFGHGPGARWGRPYPMHNEYLQVWHQYGLIGLGLLVGFIIDLSRRYVHFKSMMMKDGNRMLFASFVIICVNMIGNYPLHLAPSAFLIIIVVGLMQRERHDNGRFEYSFA